jgi:CDP-diacylglycerol--glycerol-3-phosphate 3-phosphatidyltransferase
VPGICFDKPPLFSQVWRNIPNLISSARLCATGFLLTVVLLHRVEIFKWLLLACLLSDVVDGLIARTFHLTSKLGAHLDSLADVGTMSLAVFGTFIFQRRFVAEHSTGMLAITGLYIAEIIASFLRYGRISSFHTLLARIAAFVAGVFVMSLFIWGYQDWLFRTTVTIYVAALLEEMLLICLLPEWRNDVGGVHRLFALRGMGLWRLLRFWLPSQSTPRPAPQTSASIPPNPPIPPAAPWTSSAAQNPPPA